jgi:hypothetical protein
LHGGGEGVGHVAFRVPENVVPHASKARHGPPGLGRNGAERLAALRVWQVLQKRDCIHARR